MGNSNNKPRYPPYYHRKMKPAIAEKRLLLPWMKHGAFLIRDSEDKRGSTLSVRYADIVVHTPIKRSQEGNFYIYRSRKHFPNLQELVNHYSEHPDGLCVNLRQSFIKFKRRPAVASTNIPSYKWEIDRKSLILGNKLGEGAFGIVSEGMYNGTKVAIKQLKKGTMDTEDFLEEAQIMKYLRHPNLVKLYGVCSYEEPMYIVTELMESGSLLHYLTDNIKSLGIFQLLDIAAQIASGMAYLESKDYLHRDLAARNILVGEKDIKICDFGLARLIKDDKYVAGTSDDFPIRWTAPEAAHGKTYTTKSDVWSYGILLTEIVTYGELPYKDKTNLEVFLETKTGYRMDIPNGCPKKLYEIMLRTWNLNPLKRPSFVELQLMLLPLSLEESKSI